MKDPYQVLGVAPTATDEEVKTAYRELARKYHPDKYRDSDLADLATEKMQEINEAYDNIKKMRAAGTTGSGASGSSYGGASGTYGAGYGSSDGYSGTDVYARVRSLINQRRYAEAFNILEGIPETERTAEWYFLMGCVNIQRRFYVDAQQDFDTACGMDPDNQEYRNVRDHFRDQLNQNGRAGSSRDEGCSTCDICAGLACMDCCCESMGHGGCC